MNLVKIFFILFVISIFFVLTKIDEEKKAKVDRIDRAYYLLGLEMKRHDINTYINIMKMQNIDDTIRTKLDSIQNRLNTKSTKIYQNLNTYLDTVQEKTLNLKLEELNRIDSIIKSFQK